MKNCVDGDYTAPACQQTNPVGSLSRVCSPWLYGAYWTKLCVAIYIWVHSGRQYFASQQPKPQLAVRASSGNLVNTILDSGFSQVYRYAPTDVHLSQPLVSSPLHIVHVSSLPRSSNLIIITYIMQKLEV